LESEIGKVLLEMAKAKRDKGQQVPVQYITKSVSV